MTAVKVTMVAEFRRCIKLEKQMSKFNLVVQIKTYNKQTNNGEKWQMIQI